VSSENLTELLFQTFWSFFAISSTNHYFHFGVAKLFLGGLIVTAWGSSTVSSWLCTDDSGIDIENCDPALVAPQCWTTGIATAAFDGLEL